MVAKKRITDIDLVNTCSLENSETLINDYNSIRLKFKNVDRSILNLNDKLDERSFTFHSDCERSNNLYLSDFRSQNFNRWILFKYKNPNDFEFRISTALNDLKGTTPKLYQSEHKSEIQNLLKALRHSTKKQRSK